MSHLSRRYRVTGCAQGSISFFDKQKGAVSCETKTYFEEKPNDITFAPDNFTSYKTETTRGQRCPAAGDCQRLIAAVFHSGVGTKMCPCKNCGVFLWGLKFFSSASTYFYLLSHVWFMGAETAASLLCHILGNKKKKLPKCAEGTREQPNAENS